MKRYKTRIFALFLVGIILLMSLTACGNDANQDTGAGHSFRYTLVGNPDTLDPQLAENTSAKMVLGNLFEGLFSLDADGAVQPALVKDYSVSEDGLCYHFDLRDDSYWYDAIHDNTPFGKDNAVSVTAEDFVFAFRRMFNPLYNSPYRERFSCIENAEDILNGNQDFTMLGVYAKKTYELEIKLDYPNADLTRLLASTAALPCSEAYFNSAQGRYGLDENSIIGNGGFAMQRWLYDPYGKYNVIQMCRNPLAHKVSRIYPVDLTFYIEQSDADAAKLFSAGSTDCCVTTRADLLSHVGVTAKSAYSMTLGLIAAPDSPYADSQIMEALSTALDRDAIDLQNDDVRMANAVLPPAAMLLNKSCRELLAESTYTKFSIQNAKKALEDAVGEDSSSNLPEGKILVPSGIMDYSPLRSILDIWHDTLGIHMSIEEVAEHEYESRLQSGDYILALAVLSGDSHSASSVMNGFLENAHISCGHENEVHEILEQVATAQNLNECVELYRKAESAILNDFCFVPLFYKQRYLLCQEGVDGIVFNPFSGQLGFYHAQYFD